MRSYKKRIKPSNLEDYLDIDKRKYDVIFTKALMSDLAKRIIKLEKRTTKD